MQIEILKGYETPTSRTVGDRVRWQQTAFAHLGGAFPVEISLPIESGSHAYPVGMYTLTDDSYKVGKYGSLEINNWEMKLKPVSSEVRKLG